MLGIEDHIISHRLQPLDVLLFGLLSTAYSNELNSFQNKGQGLTSVKKRHFLPLFRTAWRTAFTPANIQHAFEIPWIFPYNPTRGFSVITRPITPPEAIQASSTLSPSLKTPRSSKSIRQFQLAYRKSPSQAKLQKPSSKSSSERIRNSLHRPHSMDIQRRG
jgi:hypothetical protein